AAWLAGRVPPAGADRDPARHEGRGRRPVVLRVLVLLVIAYVALGAGLFPDKMLRGETQRGAWPGFDVHQPGDWLRLLPLLYATIFLLLGYVDLGGTTPREWPLFPLVLGLVVAPFVFLMARRLGPGQCARVAAFGVAW